MFYKIGTPKNFAKFTGKHWCWSLFSIKLKAFMPGVRNFFEDLFNRTRLGDCSWKVFYKKVFLIFFLQISHDSSTCVKSFCKKVASSGSATLLIKDSDTNIFQ